MHGHAAAAASERMPEGGGTLGDVRGLGETLEGSWVTAEVDGTLKGDGDMVVT